MHPAQHHSADLSDEEPALVGGGSGEGKPNGPIDTGVPPCQYTIPWGQAATSWDHVDATAFAIRGQDYLRDKKKIPAQPCAFQLVEVCGYNTAKGQDQRFSTERDDSYYARARSMGRKKFVFVMHFDLGATHTVMVYELHGEVFEKDPAFARCWSRFLSGDDEYKNKRIKLITSVVDANWMVRKTIGKPVPALIGNKLKCYYRQTEDMLECVCDVTSSMAAAAIVTVVKSACRNIVCDLILMIEGQRDDELPERVIGACRYIKHDITKYPIVGHGHA